MTTCTCCGVRDDETRVDENMGLCLYCQPCPWCGRMGTDCRGELMGSGCDPLDGPDGTPCPPIEERQRMRT